jgi:hypothetical protein
MSGAPVSPILDVSDDVRAEIGDDETNRLLTGENAPGSYDCTSCRTPGDSSQVRTSTVLFVGDETAVLAFAHATCIPSQVVKVSEEQVQGAVRTITADAAGAADTGATGAATTAPAPVAAAPVAAAPSAAAVPSPTAPAAVAPPVADPVATHPGAAANVPTPAPERAVLGVTCGQVLIEDTVHAAVVVEPASRIARPGSDGTGDDFLPLLIEQGFVPVTGLTQPPPPVAGWSVLVAMGQLHAILQPPTGASAQPTAWWQAHQALPVTDGWRTAANANEAVLVYAAPAGCIGQQPREDLLREALVQASAQGVLVAATMPLAGS